ncbi:MAG: enoyl-CoA hydratase/isomerase family protein [Rhodocyclaceae bacterium]|jgi:enoyl-CoA hydratase/carnithine racemase|nr:enoyl-CoA hydratase/isomerase family protein [Rhodocyclaceae bacterium]
MSASPTPRPPEEDWLGTPYLRFERRDGIAIVTIDRPEARNAFTGAMYFGIRYAVERVNQDPSLGGLLLTGVGDVFAPGGDLGHDSGDWWTDFSLFAMDIFPANAIRESAKPVVCAINGLAQGGGMMISMVADLSIASDRASFRCPELFRGIADTYYAQILPRQIGPARARDMLFTGRTLSAGEAAEWGVVARVVPHDALMEQALGALHACIRCAPEARREVKRVMDDFYGQPRKIEMNTSCFGPEAAEGFKAFKERRSPTWVPEALQIKGRL